MEREPTQEAAALFDLIGELIEEDVIVPRYASARGVWTLLSRTVDGDSVPVIDLTDAQVAAIGLSKDGNDA